MPRRLGGCAIALALLVPTQATASPPSAPQASADQRAATTTSRAVKLGHKPVRTTTAVKVRLTFEGRRGQLVNLARVDAADQCGGRVLRRGGTVVKPWAQGYWRLPRTGTYTAVNKACQTGGTSPVRLQVRRVVREDRLTGDAVVTVGSGTRVTHLVPFRVDEHERVAISGSRLDLIDPDRSITRDIHVEYGYYPVSDQPGPGGGWAPTPRGRYFAAVAPQAEMHLSVSMVQTVGVDGPPVVVPAERYARLTFTGDAGQWIYAEITSAATGEAAYRHRMYNVLAGAEEFLPAVPVDCPGSGPGNCMVVQLPASGAYDLSVPLSPGDDLDVAVRVRSALRAAPATVNGPAVAFTATSPGQWVVGDLPELPRDESGGSGVTMTVSNASTSLTDWRVRAASGYGPCNPGLFPECFNSANAITLSPSALTSPMPWDAFANQAVAILAVPPDVTGSLDLTLTRPPSGS